MTKMATKTLPPLPRSVYFPAGRVKVTRKAKLMETQQAFGMFNWVTREIQIDKALALQPAWMTLFHETLHVIMMDAGIQMDEVTEERLCDTYAAYRVAEMLR
jgi:pyrroline-5-carboxylate reductase